MSAGGHEVVRVAERALLVRFTDADLARAVARAHAVAARLRRAAPPGDATAAGESRAGRGRHRNQEHDTCRHEDEEKDERLPVKGEWILGAGNLLLRLDDSCAAREVEATVARLDEVLQVFPFDESFSSGRAHSIDVAFGHENGPDLPSVAREVGLQEDEIVAGFCAAEYTVAFVGFSPGFPYLIGLPRELEVARLAAPRTSVPAGSVAIAGPFAGVYPSATPGGWRLLGRTGERLFDPAADPPARFAPGDRVRFVAS